MPPGLTEPVSEQPGAAWKQHTNWEQHTNQTITHNSIIPKQCSETSHFPAPFRFLFTFPGVIRRPMPSGAQRKLSETGKTPKSHSPTPEGVGLPRAITSLRGRQKLLQSRRVGVVHDKLLQKGFRLSVSGGSFPPRPPARFAMPAARGKTSLNARDW